MEESGVVHEIFGFALAKDMILVYWERGCWSEVGRQGELQLISLGEGCEQIGTAAHEIGHALGLWHTQGRYDRDKFVTIVRENINETYIEQFTKETRKTNNNYNLTYDYGSIMHYGARSGATDKAEENGNLTVVPKIAKYTETLGSHIIAFYDLLMINTHYNCTGLCKGVPTKCYNGGFAHPRDCSKCICPSGYGGKFCSKRPTGCGGVLRARRQWQMLEGNLNGSEVGLDGYRRCNYWIKVYLLNGINKERIIGAMAVQHLYTPR
ncbi:astacin, partial [Teladorsagia circumcincta]